MTHFALVLSLLLAQPTRAVQHAPESWHVTYIGSAQERARETNRPIFIAFHDALANECNLLNSKVEHDVYGVNSVNERLTREFVPLRVYAGAYCNFYMRDLAAQFQIPSLPYCAVLFRDGRYVKWRPADNADGFMNQLDHVFDKAELTK